jgi:pimeloyl-ACP methyl ester carboxylesterase
MAAYDPALTARLPRVLEDARDGDGRALSVLAGTYRSSGDFGAYLATLCADGPFPRTDEGAEALAAELGDTAPRAGPPIVNELLPCTSWVATDPPDPAPVTAPGSPTILVVGNRGDVATPLAQAEAVAERLADAVLVVHEGAGHASYASSPCVQALVAAYLVELTPPDDGTTCRD